MNKLKELINKLCPNGVKFEELKEICMVSIGEFVHKNKQREDAKYPVFNGGISNTGFYDEYNNEGNKILISARGANAGFINKIESRYWAGNSCYSIDVKDKSSINWLYVYYYLKNNEKNLLGQQQTGSIPAISKKQIESFKIAVPPLEVQCEIVHILDDFTLLSAELSAELKAREKQYDYYTEKIWSYLENEKRVRLDTICEIGDGLHGTPEYENNTKLWFINGNNLENGRIIINKSTKEISNKSYNKYNGNYKIGTILMSINGTIGKIAYYTGEKIILGKSAAYFEVIEENTVCNKYLYYYLQSKKALQYFENNKTGSTIKNLGLKALREMKIPFPNRGKQEEIAGKLEKLDKLCNDISEGLPAEIEARQKQYEYYRDKLLTFKELKVNE